MAVFNVELRERIGGSFGDNVIYPKAHWNNLDGIPSTFTPVGHSHNTGDLPERNHHVGSWAISVSGQGYNFVFSPAPPEADTARICVYQNDLEQAIRIKVNGTTVVSAMNAPDNVTAWVYYDVPTTNFSKTQNNTIRIEHDGTSADWGTIYEVVVLYGNSVDSHNHDDRYYTETESDTKYLNASNLNNGTVPNARLPLTFQNMTDGITNLPYKYDLIVYGDSDKYYPVHFAGGNQNTLRTIKIWRSYSEQGPDDWNTASHKGSLNLVWQGNYGGWGGAVYTQWIFENSSQYTTLFAGTQLVDNSYAMAFFLRGGGVGGAIYHISSDQPLSWSSGYLTYTVPTPFYNQDKTFDHSNDIYDRYAPVYKTTPNTTQINDITVVKGNDSRLSNARVASDVYAWAKLQSLFYGENTPNGDLNNSAYHKNWFGSVLVTSNAPNNVNGWYLINNVRHRGGQSDGNVYGYQIAIGMTVQQNRMFIRTQTGASFTAWAEIYSGLQKPTAQDVGALPIGGGELTGQLTVDALGIKGDSLDGYTQLFSSSLNGPRVEGKYTAEDRYLKLSADEILLNATSVKINGQTPSIVGHGHAQSEITNLVNDLASKINHMNRIKVYDASTGGSGAETDLVMILCPLTASQNVIGTLYIERTSGHKGGTIVDIVYSSGTTAGDTSQNLRVIQNGHNAGDFSLVIRNIGGTDYACLRRTGSAYFLTSAWFIGYTTHTSNFGQWFVTPAGGSTLTLSGNMIVGNQLFEGANRVYSAGNKPTPADIGALGLAGGVLTGLLTIDGLGIKGDALEGYIQRFTSSDVGPRIEGRYTVEDRYLKLTADDILLIASNVKIGSELVATQNYVATQIANLIASAPSDLDTLHELAEALGDDPNFATTVNTALGNRVVKNADIVAGTKAKITYDAKGLVTGGTDLAQTDIPALSPSKITQDANNRFVTDTEKSTWNAKLGSVPNDHVTNARLANMAVNTIKGRISAGTGDPEDLTPAQLKTMLALGFADIAGSISHTQLPYANASQRGAVRVSLSGSTLYIYTS